MIKAIIFDVGKVLISDNSASWYIAKTLNVDHKHLWSIMKPLSDDYLTGKISRRKFWAYILKEIGMNRGTEQQEKYTKAMLEIYLKDKKTLKHGTVKIINELKKKNYKLAILSNIFPDTALLRSNLKMLKILRYKFLSPETKMKKPQKQAYLYAAKKMNVKPAECLFIDNELSFIKGARKAGMKTILFKNSQKLERDLKNVGVL